MTQPKLPFSTPEFLRNHILRGFGNVPGGGGVGGPSVPPATGGVVFYQEDGVGATATEDMDGTEADTLGVGSNLYNLDGAGSTYNRLQNSVGIGTNIIKRVSGASSAYRMRYDLGKSTFKFTGSFFMPTDDTSQAATFWFLADATGSYGVRVGFFIGGSVEFRVEQYTDTATTPALIRLDDEATVPGISGNTWYAIEVDITPTSIRVQVPALSIDSTSVIDDTYTDYTAKTHWAFGSFVSTAFTAFDTFEASA